MPKNQQNSPVVVVALLLSLVFGLALAAYYVAPLLLSPREPAPAVASAVTPDPAPADAPDPTPAPTASPAPTEAPPTPEPTASPVAASPSPTVAPPSTKDQGVTLLGSIRTAEGEPVAGGQIYVVARGEGKPEDVVRASFRHRESHEVITADEQGNLRARLAADRPFLLGLMINGEPVSRMQEVHPTAAGEQVNAAFNLPPSYEIRGTVTDEFAALLAGMPLVLEWMPESLREPAPQPRRSNLETDADGRFVVRLLEPSKLSIAVDREALPEPYLYQRPPLELTPADFRDGRTYRVDFQVTTGATLGGRVVQGPHGDDPGAALAGVRLELMEATDARARNPPRTFMTASDEEGYFSFERLPPVVYSLTATLDGYMNEVRRDLNAVSGEPQEVAMTPLARGVGTVHLTMPPASLPADARATISLVNRYEARDMTVEFVAGTPAPFSFTELGSGNFIVVATYRDGDAVWYAENALYVGAAPVVELGNLELRPLVEVQGRLIGGAGDAGRDHVVTAELLAPAAGTEREVNGGKRRIFPLVSTSDTGRFALENLLAGVAYRLEVRDRHSGEVLGTTTTIAGTGTGAAVLLPTGGVGTLTGRVVAADGTACVGLGLRLVTGLGISDAGQNATHEWNTVSRFDGTYRFENVPVGQARLTLMEETEVKRLLSIPRGKVLNVDMACRLFIDVDFELVTGDGAREMGAGEQFLVVAEPGTVVSTGVRELRLEEPRLRLEPGRYTITRTATMDARPFEVLPRMVGRIQVEF